MKEFAHTGRFIPDYIRNEWFWKQFRSTILMNTKNYPHIEIHSTLHKKWMILIKRAPFNYSNQFKKLFHTFRFIPHYIRNEWFWPEFCSTILMNSRNYPKHWDSWHIAYEINDSDQSCVQLFWSIQNIIPYIEIHSALDSKWMFVTRVVFWYSDDFKKLCDTLAFIANCVRNLGF